MLNCKRRDPNREKKSVHYRRPAHYITPNALGPVRWYLCVSRVRVRSYSRENDRFINKKREIHATNGIFLLSISTLLIVHFALATSSFLPVTRWPGERHRKFAIKSGRTRREKEYRTEYILLHRIAAESDLVSAHAHSKQTSESILILIPEKTCLILLILKPVLDANVYSRLPRVHNLVGNRADGPTSD